MSAPKRTSMVRILDDDDSDTDARPKFEANDIPNKHKYVLKKLPKAMCNTEEDTFPLTDPFELPKHYRPGVEAALKSGNMTLETNKSFLSTIAASMFTYKKYPTADDYNNVARVIIQKYPFMKSPTGKPYVSLS